MSLSASIIRRSIVAYYATYAFQFADFTLGIFLIYFHNYVGLSYTQSMALYVVKLGVSIIFDLYGGGIADAYGRKFSYRIGMTISILAFTLPVIFIRDYYILLILAAVSGIGDALASNTLGPNLADLLEDDQPLFRKVNTRVQSVLFVSRAGAAVIGGFLYLLYPPLPFIAEAIAYSLAILCSAGVHEVAVEKFALTKNAAVSKAAESLRHLRTNAPGVFKAAIFAALVSFLAGDIFFAYYQPFFTLHGYSSSELGFMVGVVSLLSAAGTWWLHKFHHKGFRVMALVIVAVVLAINGLGFLTNLSAVVLATMMLQGLVNGFALPTLRLMMAETTPKRIRASTMSALTTLTTGCLAIALLVSGLLADHGTPQLVGGVGLAIIAVASLWFYRASRGRSRQAKAF